MLEIPFDVSVYFNDDLRDVPNDAVEMRQALIFLQAQLRDEGYWMFVWAIQIIQSLQVLKLCTKILSK